MYSPTFHNDQLFAEGFRRIAPSLGVSAHILGARLAAEDGDWYFRGHVGDRDEYSFYLTRTPDEPVDRGHPITKAVAWRWMERVLAMPENRHLLDGKAALNNLSDKELASRLLTASVEAGIPDDARALLAAAGLRLSSEERRRG